MNKPKIQSVLTTLFVLLSTSSYSNNNMSSFYSESTFLALIILSIVLIAISVLLYGIKRHLTVLNNDKVKKPITAPIATPPKATFIKSIALLIISGLLDPSICELIAE